MAPAGTRGNTILLQGCVLGGRMRLLCAMAAKELDHQAVPGLGVSVALRHSLVTEGVPGLVTSLHTGS